MHSRFLLSKVQLWEEWIAENCTEVYRFYGWVDIYIFLQGIMEITSKRLWVMTTVSNEHSTIIRTERGLTIAGTRITLYDIMGHLEAGWTPKLIQNWLPLTEEQLNAALS